MLMVHSSGIHDMTSPAEHHVYTYRLRSSAATRYTQMFQSRKYSSRAWPLPRGKPREVVI